MQERIFRTLSARDRDLLNKKETNPRFSMSDYPAFMADGKSLPCRLG